MGSRDIPTSPGTFQATNRLEEAEPLMRRALEIFEASLAAMQG